jgi:uncharacterized protein with GYD domain
VPKFLLKASYTSQGVKGIMDAGGTSRRDAVAAMAAEVGGKVESFYFAFGGTDAYVIVDYPNNQTAAAASMAVNASGAVTAEVVVLLTPEEIDEAAEVPNSYRPPGA